ncbi:MAG: hypothetical protein HeimC3_17050 [Candidatus Heimdallarchaeota archaeon LC_3]|nr:MAG: hypothetical protein HeimC3_17050 [Candidatus Heimdallarchaeota archaeon LC_3]
MIAGKFLWFKPVVNLIEKINNHRYFYEVTKYENDTPRLVNLKGLIKRGPEDTIQLRSGRVVEKCKIFQEYFSDLKKIDFETDISRVERYQEINIKEGFFWISHESFIFLVSTGNKDILINRLSKAIFLNNEDKIHTVEIDLESLEQNYQRLWHSTIRRRDQQNTQGITITSGSYYGNDIKNDIEQGVIINSKVKNSIGIEPRIDNRNVMVKITRNGSINFPALSEIDSKLILEFLERVILPLTTFI